jgi:predicted DNA-binding transcriptional regulator YafY
MRHEKLEQLLLLARTLAGSAEGLTLDEMAETVGVKRRTVERMRVALEQTFPNMEWVRDGASRRFRIPGGLDGFYQSPTVSELNALGQAVQDLDQRGLAAHARALRDLDTKVRGAMKPPVLRKVAPDLEALLQAELIAVHAGPRPVENDHLLATLREAVCAMQAVKFSYQPAGKPEGPREVAPYGVIFGRMNYLIGPEGGQKKLKSWRLDRIKNVVLTKKPAPRPADFNLVKFANASFGFFHSEPEDVVLRVLPEGKDDFVNWRFHPDQTVEYLDDGAAIVRFRASGMLELAWHLFTWQNKVQIIAPASLRSTMQFELARALTHHQSEPPVTPLKATIIDTTSNSDVATAEE